MKKQGFTLVELLAVIAILAILVIIALPNIMGMFNQAKENSFLVELKEIYKLAKETWINDSLTNTQERIYARSKSEVCNNQLDLSGRQEIEYYIKINQAGNVTEYYATDGTFGFKYEGLNLEEKDIKDVFRMADLSEDDLFEIKCNKVEITANTPPAGADLLMQEYNPMSTTETFMRTRVLKSQIEKLTFTNSLEGHVKNNVDVFDAGSYGKGKILSWVEDKDSNGLYEITIGSEERIFPSSCSSLFAQLTNLKELKGLENINTYNCDNMMYMFYQCNTITSLDLSRFKTKNVTNMKEMFHNCKNLKTLDLGNFNTSNVTDMYGMFSSCRELTTLNVSSFDTSNVKDMRYMFYYDYKLNSLDISGFDTKKVTHMNFMFYNTDLEYIDVSGFDTSEVKNMECMFDGSRKLKTLDLSNFNTSKVINFDNMFQACSNLEKIYASDKFVINPSGTSRRVFWGCKKLKGGSGSVWNENNIDGSYAHIDGGPSNPGYFTAK